jgi:uncharacterized protein (DUF885 family)
MLVALTMTLATAAPIQQLSDEYLHELWRASPITASQVGYHADNVDQKLDDISPAARAKRSQWLHGFAARLEKAAAATRDAEDAADAALLRENVALELLDLDEARDYTRRCDTPLDTLGEAFFQMVARPYAPLPKRAVDVVARLRALPRFLDDARAALTVDVPDFRDAAKDDGDGFVDYLAHELVPAFKDAPNSAEVKAAAADAEKAVKAYLERIAAELPKKPKGSYRYGKALYQKRFRPYLQTDLGPDAVLAQAKKRIPELHAEMARVGRQILGAGAAQKSKTDRDVIREALAKVAADHPAPSALFSTVRKDFDDARAFVRDHQLLTLGAHDNLKVIETPAFLRSQLGVAAFDGAPPLMPQLGAFYYVTPFPPDWPKEKVEAKLREYNTWMLDLLTIHEAMPGHYVQFERANEVQPETRRILRWVLGAGSYIEGWAVHTQDLMVDAGFRDHDPRLKLTALKLELRAVANAVLDIELHAGDLSDEGVLKLLMDDGFQERPEAELKLRRAKLSVTQLCSYFVGGEAWRALRAEAQKRPGFDARAFYDRALAEGAVTLPTLKTLLR